MNRVYRVPNALSLRSFLGAICLSLSLASPAFAGSWTSFDPATKKGVYVQEGQWTYEGDRAGDRGTGKGVIAFSSGQRYEGDVVNFQAQGK
ncbi:MAG TPA: hypothetical protein VFM34_09990, partial [Moraxellaceae bacterium]|nr:hypothetical protein [Moraxellaceae bacterium]